MYTNMYKHINGCFYKRKSWCHFLLSRVTFYSGMLLDHILSQNQMKPHNVFSQQVSVLFINPGSETEREKITVLLQFTLV